MQHLITGAVVAALVYALVQAVLKWRRPKPRKLWAGSKPITDPATRDWLTALWWETYHAIDPEDRRQHEPLVHWWIYLDAPLIPGGYLGYWTAPPIRSIHVTKTTVKNAQLVRHECAHDILNSVHHIDKYFLPGSYKLRQFA